eukprot:3233217-Rhodomonas_salina.1
MVAGRAVFVSDCGVVPVWAVCRCTAQCTLLAVACCKNSAAGALAVLVRDGVVTARSVHRLSGERRNKDGAALALLLHKGSVGAIRRLAVQHQLT